MRTRHIGIIGAGIAGLHLGLRLQRLGIACTIITDKTPEQIAAAQLANMVVHWPTTLGRERVLGVYHWPAEEYGFSLLHNRIQTPEPIDIHCHATQPARAVDYRIYLPRLMEDFAERGGRLQVRQIDATNIGCIAERFDLIVVATPANGFQYLFARDDANSPYDRPQRYYVAGLYHGFRPAQARRATLSIAPGHGEAVSFPFLSRTGMVTALAIPTHRPDDLAMLRALSSRPGRPGFCTTLLRALEQLHPSIYGQIDTLRFDLQGGPMIWPRRPLRLWYVARMPILAAASMPLHWAMCMSRWTRWWLRVPISGRTAHLPWRMRSPRQTCSISRSATKSSAAGRHAFSARRTGPTHSCNHRTKPGWN